MTVSEIRNNIYYNENLIDQYRAEKRDLDNKIEELECLRNQITSFQDEFAAKQDNRKRGLTFFAKKQIQNKIYSNYYSGMEALLSGTEFVNAHDGLTTAKGIIFGKIQELQQTLSECEGNISYREGRKRYWQEQLRLALAEEGS